MKRGSFHSCCHLLLWRQRKVYKFLLEIYIMALICLITYATITTLSRTNTKLSCEEVTFIKRTILIYSNVH